MVAKVGPIAFEHDGESYEVAFPVNSLCALEEEFGGLSITSVGQLISSGQAGAKGVRTLFRTALLAGHPNISDIDAGRLVGELGKDAASELLQSAFDRVMAGLAEEGPDLPNADAKGRLAFEAAGSRFVLSFGMNAQAEMEDYFGGLSPEEIAAKLDGGVSLIDMRAMFRAALLDSRELSLAQAGEVMDRIGIRHCGRAIIAAFRAAFPAVPDGDGDQGADADAAAGNRQQRRAVQAKKSPTKRRPKDGTGKR